MKTRDGTVVERVGELGAPSVILIHGLGMHRSTWDQHVPALAEYFDVVRYDLIGHGESTLPTRTPDLTLFSEQCIEVMDHLEIDTAAVVGFSLGGMINRRLAIDHPQRVSALVIANSPHERGGDAQRLVEERALASTAGGPGATIDATLERWFTAEFRKTRPEAVDAVRGWVLANDPETYAQNRWVLANGVVELVRPDPPIDVPTLVITCENDTGSTPAMSHAIAAEINGAEVMIVPRRQHLGLLEDPDAFNAPIIDFLQRVL